MTLDELFFLVVQDGEKAPSGEEIIRECLELAEMLVQKNKAYRNSALKPVRIFAKGLDDEAQILVRMDDKLSRLQRGESAGEDPLFDLLGYGILLRIARKKKEM